MKQKLQLDRWRIPESWKTDYKVRIALLLLLCLGIYFLLLENVIPKTYDLKRGTISNVSIKAPIDVEDVDSTKRVREQALNSVDPVYVMQDSITKNQLKVLDNLFQHVTETRTELDKLEQKKKAEQDSASQIDKSESDLISQLKENVPYQLSDETYTTLLKLSPEALATVKTISTNIVTTIMLEGVRANDATTKSQDRVNQSLATIDLEIKARKAVKELALASIVPNIVFDDQATEEAKQRVVHSIKPVMIGKGEILVSEGEYITDDIYRKLGVAGLLTHNANYYPYMGLALFIVILIAFFHHYFAQSKLEIAKNNRHLLMFVIIVLLNLATMKITSLGFHLGYSYAGYLAPAAFGSMLIAMFMDLRLALFAGVLFSITGSIIFNIDSAVPIDYRYGFVILASSVAGAYSLGKATHRRKILASGLLVILTNIVAITAIYLLFYSIKWDDWLRLYGSAVFSGLMASVLTIGLIPFCDTAFGILSPMKLVELSNPNQPLLRRLLMETPGTYHHSVMIANLAEAAAEVIGANGLLARVGSYYHDVGKMKRPHFFIENQMGRDNPHDKIASSLSRTIIFAHVSDGIKMLEEHRLPGPIRDIAAQHHGTTLLKYFYHKANQDGQASVEEAEYRYQGPKAQFKESAIVGICDSVEAAVRSLSKPTPDRIETLVRKIIKDRLDDGQFNECQLTLQELEMITKSICQTLHGVFHSRIEYPDEIEVKQA